MARAQGLVIRAFLEEKGMTLVDEWPDISGYFGDAVFVRG